MLLKIATAAEKKQGEKKFLGSMVLVEEISHFEEQILKIGKKLEIKKDGNRQEKKLNEKMREVKAIARNLNVIYH